MFDVFFTSRSQSRPAHLYDISFGDGDGGKLRITGAEHTLYFGELKFDPAQVKHGEIESSGTLDKTTLDLKTPRTSPLVEIFRVYPPEQVVTMTIYRGELDDPDAEFIPVWRGRILNMGIEGLEATFSCEPIATAVRRPGLRRTYQYGCPHILYGPQCKASKTAASIDVSVVAINGSVVTLTSEYAVHPTEKYLNGLLEWSSPLGRVSRTILQVLSNDQVLLAGTVPHLFLGDTATAVLGCGHAGDDCKNLHNNIPNYGGHPWITRINPLGARSPFY